MLTSKLHSQGHTKVQAALGDQPETKVCVFSSLAGDCDRCIFYLNAGFVQWRFMMSSSWRTERKNERKEKVFPWREPGEESSGGGIGE